MKLGENKPIQNNNNITNILFCSENSPYNTALFNENGCRQFPIRKNGAAKALSAIEYVSIVSDVLRMKKNLCICRHFHRMDKMSVLRGDDVRYIDVWPINVFDPSNTDPFDVVSLFMMQLSCIIDMLAAWKRMQLRVFMCESGNAGAGDASE